MRELVSQCVLSDRMLSAAHDDALINAVRRQIAGGFITPLIVAGERPSGYHADIYRDMQIQGWVIDSLVEAEEDSRMSALVARTQAQWGEMLGKCLAVNSIPWWRLLWLRIRRRPLVVVR